MTEGRVHDEVQPEKISLHAQRDKAVEKIWKRSSGMKNKIRTIH